MSFIALSRKKDPESEPEHEESLSPGMSTVKDLMNPNNLNLPEPNLEEFEKINDFATAKTRKSIYNNQTSLISGDSFELLQKKTDTMNSPNSANDLGSPKNSAPKDFKINILPISVSNAISQTNKEIRENIEKNDNFTERDSKLSLRTPAAKNSMNGGYSPSRISGFTNSNKASIAEKTSKKSSLASPFKGGVGKKSSNSVNFQNKLEEEEDEALNEAAEKSESSDETLSQDEEEVSEESIDVIEEEDEEDYDEEEDSSPKDTQQENNADDQDNPKTNHPSEMLSNRELISKDETQNFTAIPENVDKKKRSTIKAEAQEDIEEIETLEDELNPQMDVNLMIDVYEDKENLNTSQKLRNKKQYKQHQWVLYPDDMFKSSWSLLLSLILGYTCLVTPYRVAFLASDDSETWFIIDWVTDSIFWFDILVNFVSAYYDVEDNLIVSKRAIAYNYITGWLIPDIIGVLPFDYFFDVSRYGNLVRVAKLPRLYKLVRMTKLIRVLKLIKERNTVIKYLMDVLSIGPGFERLFVSICSIFVFCHLACCFWFMAGDLNDDPENWVMHYELVDDANFDIYIASFYWITQTVVTVGYGDIAAVNTIERSIACLYMFVGVFFYSFTIGSLSSLLSSLDSKNATFDQKLNTLIQIRNQYNIDNLLYNRVKRALKYGTAQKDDEKIDFLNDLPLNLRIELSVIMHKNVVSGIEFFRNKPATFIALIGPYLKPFHIGENEYIFHEGEYADEMYFIKEGSVSMVLKDFNNFEFITIDKGYYFGEVDLLFGDTRKYTYMASTDLELLALKKKDFNKIFFYEFREIGSELYKNAIKRRIRSHKTYKEAIEFCQKQVEKKRFTADNRVKSSIYGFRPQRSIAKKSATNRNESDFLFQKLNSKRNESLNENNNPNFKNFLEPPALQEIKESEEKAKFLESIIEEASNQSPLLSNELVNNDEETHENIEIKPNQSEKRNTTNSLFKFTQSIAKSNLAKKSLGLDKFFNPEQIEKKNEFLNEGLQQMNAMENKMKSIETNMEEIFQFYKSLGIEFDPPAAEKENTQTKSPQNLKINNTTSLENKNEDYEINNEEDIKKEERKTKDDSDIKSQRNSSSLLNLKVKALGMFKSMKNKKI